MSIKQGGNTIAGSVGQSPLSEKNISNCITEIPQDINLELAGGILTLKAGSKVYVPNGAGVFDTYTAANDITSNSFAGSVTRFVFIDINNNTINAASAVFSGSSAPTVSGVGFWYDTTNNVIKRTTDSGSTWTSGFSFPIAIVTSVNDVATSIDRVFNGFGYIGSTIFALPGVKGLIPNGRNADGTLNNIESDVTSVRTLTLNPQTYSAYFGLTVTAVGLGSAGINEFLYDEKLNRIRIIGGSSVWHACIYAFGKVVSGKITEFTPKTAFHAVDYNDSEYIAHQAMPSSRYDSLTVGASGTTYTAPADGWFYISATTSGTNYQVIMAAGCMSVSFRSNSLNQRMILPVSKGMVMTLQYDGTLSNTTFRFVYTNGAQ